MKTYPQRFKAATQRLKKLAQDQLLHIVAERALLERKVTVTAEGDWRASSKHLKKADVKVSAHSVWMEKAESQIRKVDGLAPSVKRSAVTIDLY